MRLYTFLSQIFDYGNTAIEKRVDLLQAAPAAAGVRPRARRDRPLEGGADPSQPEEPGQARDAARRGREPQAGADHRSRRRRACRRRRRRCLNEIIEKVNDLFEGDLTDQDKLCPSGWRAKTGFGDGALGCRPGTLENRQRIRPARRGSSTASRARGWPQARRRAAATRSGSRTGWPGSTGRCRSGS